MYMHETLAFYLDFTGFFWFCFIIQIQIQIDQF